MAVKKIKSFLNWKPKGKPAMELPLLPDRTPQETLDHYSMQYPELTTASVGKMVVDPKGHISYEVQETLGTKG